ncbi:MAG TPA: hypothetical protein VD931_07700 [Baekduia sp.]|nr:hypothetical protein [Baekduia sp.]
MLRRAVVLLLLAVPVLASPAAVAPAHAVVQVGIADQKTGFLLDERFAQLGVRLARISMPYDVLDDPNTLEPVEAWIRGAQDRRMRVLVTFDRSRRPGRKSITPTPAEMATQLRRIRSRWPWLREFSTWNEGNINKRAERVAPLWLALQRACPSCTVLGADLLDRPNAAAWAQRFAKAAGRWPKAWGLHNYVDANRLRTTETRKILKGIRGELWLTETGGVVARNNGSAVRFAGTGNAHAARATAFLFDRLVPSSPRITRVYLYHWDTPEGQLTWDSGLVGPDNQPRPALDVLRERLRRLRLQAARVRASCSRPSASGRPSGRKSAACARPPGRRNR